MHDLFKKISLLLFRSVPKYLLPVLLTIRFLGFFLAGLALWSFAEISEDILEKESFAFDQQILFTLQDWHTPLLDQIMVGVTFLGNTSVLAGLIIVTTSALIYWKKRSEATVFVIAALGASGLNVLLKDLFARDRPQLWEQIVDVQFYSFPSGHAMISLVIYSMIAYILATNFPKLRGVFLLFLIPLVLAIGFSRLYLGVHYPTDIIAGYAAGFVWLTACISSAELWQARHSFKSSLKQWLKADSQS